MHYMQKAGACLRNVGGGVVRVGKGVNHGGMPPSVAVEFIGNEGTRLRARNSWRKGSVAQRPSDQPSGSNGGNTSPQGKVAGAMDGGNLIRRRPSAQSECEMS